MWKFRIGMVCIVTGAAAFLSACILVLFGFGASNKTQVWIIIGLLGVMFASISVYLTVDVIWLIFFTKRRMALESDTANDIAEKLREQIGEWRGTGRDIRLDIKISPNGRFGYIVEIWKEKSIEMFIRVSLSAFARHYALNVPRRSGRISRYFFFADGKELLSEAKKEMGFLVSIAG